MFVVKASAVLPSITIWPRGDDSSVADLLTGTQRTSY